MIRLQPFITGLALIGGIVGYHSEVRAGGKADSKVKATATATKPDADGKQTVTITLEIERGLHLYANPVKHEFLEGNELTVKVAAKEKVMADVKYPAGKTVGTKSERYDIYEGIVKIEAQVVRTIGDASPLTIQIAIRGSDGKI